MKRLFFLFIFILLSFSALAVEPDEVLKDPVLEARAREISRGIRCLVCQGEAIDDSRAPLARDLRLLVRARLVAGDTDAEIAAFLQSRYGDFILLKPPVGERTLVLWLAPALVFAAGLFAAGGFIRRHRG